MKQSTKHTIVTVLSVAAIFAAGAYAVIGYQHYRTWAQAQTAKAVKQNQEMQQASLLQQVRYNRQVEALKTQCATDHQRYVALTPAQRAAKGAQTDCDPSNLNLAQ